MRMGGFPREATVNAQVILEGLPYRWCAVKAGALSFSVLRLPS